MKRDELLARLTEVPAPSEQLFSEVERAVVLQRSGFHRGMLATAAVVLFAVAGFFVGQQRELSPLASEDVEAEFQFIYDYFDGSDIESGVESYALSAY